MAEIRHFFAYATQSQSRFEGFSGGPEVARRAAGALLVDYLGGIFQAGAALRLAAERAKSGSWAGCALPGGCANLVFANRIADTDDHEALNRATATQSQ